MPNISCKGRSAAARGVEPNGRDPSGARFTRTRLAALTRHAAHYITRLLRHFGAEPRIFDPSDLPLPDQVKGDDHPAVHDLRDIAMWSEGQVWCSPERHGQITA